MNEFDKKVKHKRILQYSLKFILFILGLLIFALFMQVSGLDGIHQLKQVTVLPIVGIIVLTFGITGVAAYRWGNIVNAVGGRKVAKWTDYYRYFIVSRAMGLVFPKDIVDLFGRATVINRRHSLSISRSGISVIFDRFFDFTTAIIFLFSSLPYWFGVVGIGKGIAIMISLSTIIYVLFLIYYQTFFRMFIRIAENGIKFVKYFPIMRKLKYNHEDLHCLNRELIFTLISLSVVKFSLIVCRFSLIAIALQLSISPNLFVLGTPVGQLAYIVAVTPGGLGIFEAGWFSILCYAGIDFNQASMFVVGQRILIMIGVVFIFGIVLLKLLISLLSHENQVE